MTTKKLKNKQKNKTKSKRFLKRVYHEATSAQSSWSSLVSSYMDIEDSNDLQPELASNIDLQPENVHEDQGDGHMAMIFEENEGEEAASLQGSSSQSASSPERNDSYSLPADEYYDSEANLQMNKNSPRESFKVFNQ